jgi:hypothetical protein
MKKKIVELELMKEITLYTYMMQANLLIGKTMPQFVNTQKFQEVPQFQKPP